MPDVDHQRLPYDVAELIIDFASDPPTHNQVPGESPTPKTTLLVCALVCKTWLSHTRRRLLSLYFASGVVEIFSAPQNFLTFSDIFRSPLCTLDPAFIRGLSIVARPDKEDDKVFPFLTLSSILSEISFPSLDTLRFRDTFPKFNEGESDRASFSVPPTTFPQVKNLIFEFRLGSPEIGLIALTSQFFPCLESLAVFEVRPGTQNQNERLFYLLPPQSLRKLVADKATFVYLAEWLAACSHTNISSLSIEDGFSRDQEVDQDFLRRLFLALDVVGRSLKELQLGIVFNTGLDAI